MKRLFYCHYENYEEITKSEARAMLRSYQSFSLIDFINYYQIPSTEVYKFMRSRGMTLTKQERAQLREINENDAAAKRELNSGIKANGSSVNQISFDVSEWPVSLVCALNDIPFEKIKGKRSYDIEQYEKAVAIMQSKITNYFKEESEETANGIELNKIDLVAMRYYRGVNRQEMAKKLIRSKSDIVNMENTSPISDEVAKAYKSALNIKDNHIYQLRKIMKGQLERVEDDRSIPGKIKVAVFARDKGKCTNCGDNKKLHYHHIEHFSQGGQNTIANLKMLCANCHAEEHKNDKSYYLLKKMAEE